jgi:hypothetical protein
MLDITTEDDDQIVALYIKGEIYLGEGAIAKAKEVGTVDRIIPRSFFKSIAVILHYSPFQNTMSSLLFIMASPYLLCFNNMTIAQ